ncbi:FAD/NAD-binding domain-containing protein [Fomitiporia mediterranea MF3/22]|uniref:FAD/NAD-binding domain-containing protein n=1 Tax=Fomitiporia mediterranea (strain MF3/22) TaxID=694068 RepID=UPI0004408B0E|nr:FAD/NAD-binding domain-containing protein [Fomitiporia mediterranea MF3/22]EJC99819.1 FAD/NAD-binding domain-containing protein [Fomitiporia mediterranea MF3/22]
MDDQPRFRIAICGGGIGGLSLAVIIGKHCKDVKIDLFEALPQFTEIGAGISVWKRTWFIMKELGLDETLGKMAVEPPVDEIKPSLCFRKSDQETEGFNFVRMMTPYGSITLHRADMLKVLMDNLPPPSMFHAHFNKRLASYSTKSNSVILHFTDGSSFESDMLVGADGIKSATRMKMYISLVDRAEEEDRKTQLKRFVQAEWSGTYGYRALVETNKLLQAVPGHQAASVPMMYCGKDKHVISYPISQGRLVNIVAFITVPGGEGKQFDGPAVVDVTKQEMLDQYKGWEPEIHSLLNCSEKVQRWAISQIRGLPTYVDGLIAILGDAAHAMTTHLGAGAGQAIEDSFILGQLLAQPGVNQSNLASVLRIYDAVRRPLGNHFVERSHTSGFFYEFNNLPEGIDGALIRAGYDVELEKLAQVIYKKWEVQWSSLPNVEWKEAKRRLKEAFETSGRNASKL